MPEPLKIVKSEEYWFPGRWVGGTAMIFGSLFLLAGVLLRLQFHFFFPQQLAAFQEHPTLITASYSFFLAGNIVLWPAIVTLAKLIGATKPAWALWGGTLVMFGLFARTFHAGVDHLAFQLVPAQDLPAAIKIMAGSYGAFHIVSSLNFAILFGCIVLALGAYLSGTLGLLRSIALGSMAALMIGVLKGSSVTSVVCVTGLSIALVPLGVAVLRAPPRPRFHTVLGWSVFVTVLIAAMVYTGQLG